MSDIARTWFASRSAGELVISWWVDVEVANAMAAKRRAGEITHEQRDWMEQAWLGVRNGIDMVGIERLHFHRAASLVDSGNGLRASDALHLALVRDRGWVLATFDRGMANAAHTVGITVAAIGG